MLGEAGMSPKYLATFSLAVARSMSLEVGHRADGAVMVGMADRVHLLAQHVEDLAVGFVLALALLVLDHAALFVQGLLVDRAEQVAHAVRLHPQGHVQRRGRHVLEIIGAVGIGGAVLAGGADLLERVEEFARGVLRAVEHQVLEQMGEAGATGGFILAADVVPDVDRHDRCLAVGVHDHPQAVGQGEFLVGDIDLHCRGRLGLDRFRREVQATQCGGHGNGEQRGAGTAQRAGGKGHRTLLVVTAGNGCSGMVAVETGSRPMMLAAGPCLYTRPQGMGARGDRACPHAIVW
jgi:hypothetical protein